MLSLITILSTLLLTGFAAAQAPTTNFSSSVIVAIVAEVGQTTRNAWCTAETTTCGVLCNGKVTNNTCDPNVLTDNCVCSSNNSAPGLAYYSGSLNSFICQQALGDCMANNANDLAGQQNCNSTYICPNLNATLAAAAAVATSTSASSSAGPTSTPASTATTSTSPSATAKSFAVKVGQDFGVGLLAAALVGALALLL